MKFLTNNFTLPALTIAQIYKSAGWNSSSSGQHLGFFKTQIWIAADLRAHSYRDASGWSESLPILQSADSKKWFYRSHPTPKTNPPMTPTN